VRKRKPDPIFQAFIEQAQAEFRAAGWETYRTEDGRIINRRPQYQLDYIREQLQRTAATSRASAQKLYLYVARDLIARNRGEQALEDVRITLANHGLIDIDSCDTPYLAESLWKNYEMNWWDEPAPKVHSKLGPRETSPFSRLRQSFRRERWKRRMDGQLPKLVHGEAAVAAMNKIALARRPSIRVDWQAVARSLDARTARELDLCLKGATVEEMGLTDYRHFQRRWPRIGGLILQNRIPDSPTTETGTLKSD
jgi:hypothetical protein